MKKCLIIPPENLGTAVLNEDAEPGSGSLYASSAILQRHGARVISPPARAAAAGQGWPAPRAAVYRASTLLLPAEFHDDQVLAAINGVLADVGMRLVSVPASAGTSVPGDVARLPRAAVLNPASDSSADVDAWAALSALRAAAVAGRGLSAEDVRKISLEHLLTSAAITGEPIVHSNPVVDGGPIVHSNAGGEPIVHSNEAIESYLYAGQDARTPLEVCMDPPARKPATAAAADYGRRPVIAVLDTGVRVHPWLDVRAGKGYRGFGYEVAADTFAIPDDGFVRVSQAMQDAIYEHARHASSVGDAPRHLIRYPWDAPVQTDDLIPPVDPHLGHGTFIAGIVRQVVPDATVLSIHVMHSDGVVYEGDLLYALGLLAAQVAAAHQSGNTALMIDAVSMSLGYFAESAGDVVYTSELARLIDSLLDMGVMVTAAAGNYTSSRPYFPAALALHRKGANQVPLLSVGALNPNGSQAAFSDGGEWVRSWASGAAVASTFPVDVNGPDSPDLEVSGKTLSKTIQSLDHDDYRGGFAAWSGTSFSAPALAASLVRAMLEPLAGNPHDPRLRLDTPGAEAAIARALLAMRQFQQSG
jgi:hypothetical protein